MSRDPVGTQLSPGELGLVPTASPRVGLCAAPQEQGLDEVYSLSHPQWFYVPPTWHLQASPISTRLAQKGSSEHFPLTDTRPPRLALSASRRLWTRALDEEFGTC